MVEFAAGLTLLGGASHSHPSLCFFALLSIIFSVPYIERV